MDKNICRESRDKWIADVWAKDGFSDNIDVVADAVTLEKVKAILSDAVKGDKENAMSQLRTIAAKDNPIGNLASLELAKYEQPDASGDEGGMGYDESQQTDDTSAQ